MNIRPDGDRDFYNSSRWRKVSKRVRDGHPWCSSCADKGLAILHDLQVDHIIPLSHGGARYDPRNLRVLCRQCHIVKTMGDTMLAEVLRKGGITEAEVKEQPELSKTIDRMIR